MTGTGLAPVGSSPPWGRDPLWPGEWFATGDLVSVSGDGYVTVRGRRTELIIDESSRNSRTLTGSLDRARMAS